ncbi:hypothetical protein CDAR_194891 [Caerostris darwini]|uniref:Uncharacterized protein n=1 Tax=Caerostris darwini TaxID=1538125 RepID=A0AAV4X6G7_9ARAC|nr:hypothetical protein CDAR_194891 [Caerostris darwini]
MATMVDNPLASEPRKSTATLTTENKGYGSSFHRVKIMVSIQNIITYKDFIYILWVANDHLFASTAIGSSSVGSNEVCYTSLARTAEQPTETAGVQKRIDSELSAPLTPPYKNITEHQKRAGADNREQLDTAKWTLEKSVWFSAVPREHYRGK